MNTTDKKILREEAIQELKRELAMRAQVWAQSKPFDPVSGPTFKERKHQEQYARIEVVLTVIEALSPEQFFDLWTASPYEEPGQETLF